MYTTPHSIVAGVEALPLPKPFSLDRFAHELGEVRGRPVRLQPVLLPGRAPCGLLISTDHADHICYAHHASPLHQRHIVFHEVGHLQLGHTSKPQRGRIGQLDRIMPNLSTVTIARLLGRTGHPTDQERHAELFATLAGCRVDRLRTAR